MKKYEINQEQVDGLLKYLYGRPFIEVVQGVNLLNGLPEVKLPAPIELPKAPTELKAVENAPASS